MTTSQASHPLQRFGQHLFALVARHGSPEERRAVEAHRIELAAFLDHPDTLRFAQRRNLEIGLENRVVLKLNLMGGSKLSPWGLLDEWTERMPVFREVTETVFRHKMRCHAGITLSATGIEYEIYPFDDDERRLSNGIFARHRLDQCGLPRAPYFFGLTSTGVLSAYTDTTDDIDLAELEAATGFRIPARGSTLKAYFHSRLQPDGSWKPDKAGIEFIPFPSHLLNTALGHLDLRFAYLLYRGGVRKYGIIAVRGSRQVLYTSILPLPDGQPPAE